MKVLKLHNKLVVGLGKGAVSDGEALSEEVTVTCNQAEICSRCKGPEAGANLTGVREGVMVGSEVREVDRG